MTKTYKVTYLVTMDKDVEYPKTVASFWVRKVAQNTELELPEFIHHVSKAPSVEEVITEKKITYTNKPKGK